MNFSIYNFRIRSTTQIISIEIIVSLLLQCVKIRLLISSSSFFSSKIEPCSTNTTDRMAVELGYCKLNFNISSDFFFPPLSARSEWMEVRAISISENRTFTHHPTQTAFSRETQPDRPRFFLCTGHIPFHVEQGDWTGRRLFVFSLTVCFDLLSRIRHLDNTIVLVLRSLKKKIGVLPDPLSQTAGQWLQNVNNFRAIV